MGSRIPLLSRPTSVHAMKGISEADRHHTLACIPFPRKPHATYRRNAGRPSVQLGRTATIRAMGHEVATPAEARQIPRSVISAARFFATLCGAADGNLSLRSLRTERPRVRMGDTPQVRPAALLRFDTQLW